jgi:hypothetical protein
MPHHRYLLALALLSASGCIPKSGTTTSDPQATPTPTPTPADVYPTDPTDPTDPVTDPVTTPVNEPAGPAVLHPLHAAELAFLPQLTELASFCELDEEDLTGSCLDGRREVATARATTAPLDEASTAVRGAVVRSSVSSDVRIHERHLMDVVARAQTLDPFSRPTVEPTPIRREPIAGPITTRTTTNEVGFLVTAKTWVAPLISDASLPLAGATLVHLQGAASQGAVTDLLEGKLASDLQGLTAHTLANIGRPAHPSGRPAETPENFHQALGLGLGYLAEQAFAYEPSTTESEERAWLHSARYLHVTCEGGALVSVRVCDKDSTLAHTHVGNADVLGVRAVDDVSTHELYARNSVTEASFGWTFRVPTPPGLHLGLEAVQAPYGRAPLSVWHAVTGTVTCSTSGKATVVVTLNGSAFPSHRLWVDDEVAADLVQGPLGGLTVPAPWDPSVVSN